MRAPPGRWNARKEALHPRSLSGASQLKHAAVLAAYTTTWLPDEEANC